MKFTYEIEIDTSFRSERIIAAEIAERLEFMAILLRSEAQGGYVVLNKPAVWSSTSTSIRQVLV